MMNSHFLRLSVAIAKTDFKLRNEGSYLGILWYALNPLLLFSLLLLVFGRKLGQGIPSYDLYLLLGIIMFNLFQQVTVESVKILYENRWIIRSVKFDHASLVFSAMLRSVFSHVFDVIVFCALALLLKSDLSGMVFYPVVLIPFCLFITGSSLILASMAVYFADMENIWLFASRLLWLGTPIFYALDTNDMLFALSLFNPIYYFLTLARELVIYNRMPQSWVVIGALCYSLGFFILGLNIFNRLKHRFAELM